MTPQKIKLYHPVKMMTPKKPNYIVLGGRWPPKNQIASSWQDDDPPKIKLHHPGGTLAPKPWAQPGGPGAAGWCSPPRGEGM